MNLFEKISNWYFSKKALPYWCILLMDCVIVFFSFIISYLILNGDDRLSDEFHLLIFNAALASLTAAVYFKLFHTYRGVVRFSSFVDLWRVAMACFCLWITLEAVVFALRTFDIPKDYLVFPSYVGMLLVGFIALMLMCIARVTVRMLYDTFRIDSDTERALVYGIKAGGIGIAKSIRSASPLKYLLKGFIDPESASEDSWLMGVKVYNDDDSLKEVIRKENIEAIFVSPLQADRFRASKELVSFLVEEGINILMMPSEIEWDGRSDIRSESLRKVQIEDLLPREKIEVDMQKIGEHISGRVVLITGAAGSIGSEMVRQVARFKPSRMVLIDSAETPMHDIRLMMAEKYPYIVCSTIVSSITNAGKMEALFAEAKPYFVFHAAAYKHVPMMEDNPSEAVQNNIRGTRVIADLSVKYGVKKFVMISTDKAVNPTNVMGCSKRICEIYCQSLNQAIVEGKVKGVTQFVTTRFGNVLGSNGSVIPLFRKQIAKGGPITVTHPDIIRYFMLIPEACKLVLEAGTMGKGGEIFVFDMGEPVRIVDLAKRMIRLSGAKNIEIQFTGLRDGEKLYEEVLSDKENTVPTIHPKIMVAKVREYDYADACANEDRLMKVAESYDDMAIVKVMKEIVPEFKSQVSKYSVLD